MRSFLQLLRDLYGGLLTSLSAATLLGSSHVGVDYDIGDWVVEAVRRQTAPLVQRPLEEAAAMSLGSLYTQEEGVKGWVDFAINAACSSVSAPPSPASALSRTLSRTISLRPQGAIAGWHLRCLLCREARLYRLKRPGRRRATASPSG